MELITLKEFQDYTGIYDDETKQSIYVDSAEKIVESYLGYNPIQKSITVKYDGNGKNNISLYQKNVTAISSVLIDNTEMKGSCEFGEEETDELLYCSSVFSKGHKNISVSFTAGWKAADLPADIKMTVLRIAALLQTESGGNIGVNSKSFDSGANRTFIQTKDYSSYLIQISNYKVIGY